MLTKAKKTILDIAYDLYKDSVLKQMEEYKTAEIISFLKENGEELRNNILIGELKAFDVWYEDILKYIKLAESLQFPESRENFLINGSYTIGFSLFTEGFVETYLLTNFDIPEEFFEEALEG